MSFEVSRTPNVNTKYKSLFTCSEIQAFGYLVVGNRLLSRSSACQGALWRPAIRYAFDREGKKSLSESSFSWFCDRIDPYLDKPLKLDGVVPATGLLGQSIVGGGKRRIFAIGHYVNQRDER